jgi:hypothetical protein
VYRAMTAWRRAAAVLALVTLLPACVSSRPMPALAVADAPSASPGACAADGGDAVRAGLLGAASFGTYLMLRGAAEGALWGAVRGGSAGKDATWIGAVVGLGVGTLVGFVMGAGNGIADYQRRAACLVVHADDRPAHPDGRLTVLEQETLLPED